METITAIVPAAGCGARAALNGNKILALLGGKTLLFWTLRTLREAGIDKIIVAAQIAEFDLVRDAAGEIPIEIVEGGKTRQRSVLAGVQAAHSEFVLVHDAARPCVSTGVIHRVFQAAQECGAAIAALPASDTIKVGDHEGNISKTLDRREIWLAQTPQVFRRLDFHKALLSAERLGVEGTDCASIVEEFGGQVRLVEGEADNLKVTYAPDLERAETILRKRGLI